VTGEAHVMRKNPDGSWDCVTCGGQRPSCRSLPPIPARPPGELSSQAVRPRAAQRPPRPAPPPPPQGTFVWHGDGE